MGKTKESERPRYSMESTLRTFSIKCYAEQMCIDTTDMIATEQRDAMNEKIKQALARIDPKKWCVIAIVHYKDYNHDKVWGSSAEKPHIHIYGRILDKKKPCKVRTILNVLEIKFRNPEDENLFKEHGVESCKNFVSCAMYLTHDTEQAELDGKAHYDVNEIISNYTPQQVENIRAGYIGGLTASGKIDFASQVEMDETAFTLGYKLKDFEAWYNELNLAQRKLNTMRIIKESYQRGVQKRVDENATLNRLCIFIQGKPGIGKTYFAQQLPDHYIVDGGGSGKFDRLKPSHQTLVINDYHSENILNLSDNYMCQTYKRNRDNAYWCGNLLIVTANTSFDDWLRDCGIDKTTDAYRSRFYICQVTSDLKLQTLSVSKRGTYTEQKERLKKFTEFKELFEKSLQEYSKIKDTEPVDYTSVIGTGFVKATDSPF